MDSTGTDTFRYVVVDTTASRPPAIRVGIAAPSQINSRPIAVLDTLTTARRTVRTRRSPTTTTPTATPSRSPTASARMQDDIGPTRDETELVMVAPQEQGDYHGT